jgi:hypothetical protein
MFLRCSIKDIKKLDIYAKAATSQPSTVRADANGNCGSFMTNENSSPYRAGSVVTLVNDGEALLRMLPVGP